MGSASLLNGPHWACDQSTMTLFKKTHNLLRLQIHLHLGFRFSLLFIDKFPLSFNIQLISLFFQGALKKQMHQCFERHSTLEAWSYSNLWISTCVLDFQLPHSRPFLLQTLDIYLFYLCGDLSYLRPLAAVIGAPSWEFAPTLFGSGVLAAHRSSLPPAKTNYMAVHSRPGLVHQITEAE